MKHGRFKRKNICKNRQISVPEKYISSQRQKTPGIAAAWGRTMQENPTKRAVMLSENASNREKVKMLHFRPGGQVWQLITLLSVTGGSRFAPFGCLGRNVF